MDKDKVSIEEAINRAGFGLYSCLLTSMAGVAIISSICIGYSSTILVPASACELETTATQQGLLAATPVTGSIIGGVLWGYLADTRGRRKMLLASLLGGALVNSIASLSVNWIMLMIVQFCATIFSSGLFSTTMSLLSESVPMVRRNLVVLLVTSIFLLSQGIMAVLAIPVIPLSFSIYVPALGIYWNSWRTLVLVYSIPGFVTAIWLFFMQESPKFVFSQGDEQKTLEILKTIYRINHLRSGKELEVNSILKEKVKMTDQGTVEKQNLFLQLFRMPLLKYTIIMIILQVFQQAVFFNLMTRQPAYLREPRFLDRALVPAFRIGAFLIWLPTVANQFVRIIETGEGSDLTLCGIIQAGIDTPEDPNAVPCALNITALLIVLIVGALQSFFNLCLSLIVNSVGRRNIVLVLATVCGVSGILVNLIPNAIGSAVMFAVLLQGFIVLGMYTAMSVALFPTQLRALAIAVPMMAQRMSMFATIQILNVMFVNNCEASFYLFASIFTSSAIVASFLPDDRRLRPPPAPLAPATSPDALPASESKTELAKNVYETVSKL